MTKKLPSINESTSPAIFQWRPACWLRIFGPDAAIFLQGQFTNELRGLAPDGAVYGLWLSIKGKVIADSFVLRGAEADEFWIGSYFSPASVVRERLESHIIADDVTIEDVTSDWAAVSIFGTADAGPAPAGVLTFQGRRSRAPNIEWIFPTSAAAAVRARLESLTELNADDMARRRIVAGIPAVPSDVGPGDLPNEAGLEPAAISYTKGCYLGQEVMARLKSMGQVRRRLLRVQGANETLPKLPAPLFVGTRQVGELRSAVWLESGDVVGLAMLSLLHVSTGAELALAPGGVPALRLLDPP